MGGSVTKTLAARDASDGGFFGGKELYVLRNLSKGRGVGFFEAGNFHPDFILWLLIGDMQHVIFVDPKGILHLGADDPKIRFYRTIKEVEERLAEPRVRLHSFIVSNTPSFKMRMCFIRVGPWLNFLLRHRLLGTEIA